MEKSLLARSILLGAVLMLPLASWGATVYISDELAVPLRRGPSSGHRILHAGLPSGTPLEVLGEDKAAGFTHVRTRNGTEGWVPTQYITTEPIARDRLAAANRRIESLEAQLKSLRETYQEARGARSASEDRAGALEQQTQKLQTELAEIRRVSANALANHEENQQLKSENQSLRAQVSELSHRVQQLERNVMVRALLSGGGLVLLGLVIGTWFKSRRKRSIWA